MGVNELVFSITTLGEAFVYTYRLYFVASVDFVHVKVGFPVYTVPLGDCGVGADGGGVNKE